MHLRPAQRKMNPLYIKKIAEDMTSYYENSQDYLKNLDSEKLLRPYIQMIDMFLPNKKIKVLEVGCGSGISTKLIGKSKSKIDLVAVDASKQFIDYAQKNYETENIMFGCQDVTCLSYEDGSFDFVVMHNVIEHIPNPQKALEEIARVLKKGGNALIMSPNHLSPITPLFDFLTLKKRPPFTRTWVENISHVFKNSYVSMKKILSKKIDFILVEPILDDSIQTGGDADSTYLSNQIDLIKWFKKRHFRIIKVAYAGKGLSKIVGILFPLFTGGFCLLAEKQTN